MDTFTDNSQNIWLATYEGINLIKKQQFLLRHHLFNYEKNTQIVSLAETGSGDIWFISNTSKLYHFDRNHQTHEIDVNIEGPYYQLIANENTLWFVTENNNLYQVDTLKKSAIKISKWKSNSQYDFTGNLNLKNNNIWFINNQGKLSKFSTINQTFKPFTPPSKSQINTITVQEDVIWLLTSSNELLTFDLQTGTFETIALPVAPNFILSAATQLKVFKEWLWVGSRSQGIALINLKNNQVQVYNENSFLNNNYINAILINEQGQAWCSTNKGLSFIDPFNYQVKNYHKDFGLDSNEFLESSALKAKNGSYYFGGNNGIHQFKQSDLDVITTAINPPVFTDLLIANKQITITQEKQFDTFTLKESLNENKTITLKHNLSPFSIEFISPNNKLPERIKYRYRLAGLENNWIDSGINNRRATYTNLSAGNYTFVVQAYDRYDPSNVQTSNLAIKNFTSLVDVKWRIIFLLYYLLNGNCLFCPTTTL